MNQAVILIKTPSGSWTGAKENKISTLSYHRYFPVLLTMLSEIGSGIPVHGKTN